MSVNVNGFMVQATWVGMAIHDGKVVPNVSVWGATMPDGSWYHFEVPARANFAEEQVEANDKAAAKARAIQSQMGLVEPPNYRVTPGATYPVDVTVPISPVDEPDSGDIEDSNDVILLPIGGPDTVQGVVPVGLPLVGGAVLRTVVVRYLGRLVLHAAIEAGSNELEWLVNKYVRKRGYHVSIQSQAGEKTRVWIRAPHNHAPKGLDETIGEIIGRRG